MSSPRVLIIERKKITLLRGQNNAGEFLRLTEECHGVRHAIVIPLSGVSDVARELLSLLEDQPS